MIQTFILNKLKVQLPITDTQFEGKFASLLTLIPLMGGKYYLSNWDDSRKNPGYRELRLVIHTQDNEYGVLFTINKYKKLVSIETERKSGRFTKETIKESKKNFANHLEYLISLI